MNDDINWKVDWWVTWLLSFLICLIVQGIIYKIYKCKPLENEKHKDIYMGVNGVFIVIDVFLLFVASEVL